MIKIDLKTQLQNLKGEPFSPDVKDLSEILANALANGQEKNPMKHYHWAKELTASGELLVDESDYKILVAFIEGEGHQLSNLTRGQLLEKLDEAKTSSKRAKA